MTNNIKETSLQELENVTGGAAQEFGQIASIVLASPIKQQYAKLADSEILSNNELAIILKDKLSQIYAIDADFYAGANHSLNIYRDQMTGKKLAYADVLDRILV